MTMKIQHRRICGMQLCLAEKFIALTVYIRKEERCKINYLRFHFMKLEKEEQSKPKVGIRKETLKSKNQWNRKQ